MDCRNRQQLLSPPVSRLKLRLIVSLAVLLFLCFPGQLLAIGNNSLACPNPVPFKLEKQPLIGIILPHHQTAKMVWEPTFKQLADQKITRFILLSPNHFLSGKQSIITASQSSAQENLYLPIDQQLVTLISQSAEVEDNAEIVWQDHGITNLIPLIKKDLPNAQLVPVIFKKNVNLQRIDGLVKAIAPYLDDQTVVIASLDFAHEVVPESVLRNDQQSVALIKKRGYSQLLKLSSHYVDSPAALVMFLKLMDLQKAKTNLIWQAHAGEFNHDCVSETTSYQVWVSKL